MLQTHGTGSHSMKIEVSHIGIAFGMNDGLYVHVGFCAVQLMIELNVYVEFVWDNII